MKKGKLIILTIVELLISIVPLVVYFVYNYNDFLQNDTQITILILVFMGTIALLVFKDLTSKWLKTPSAFKYALVMLILSGLALLFGDTLFEISLVATLSFGAASILRTITNYLGKKIEDDTMVQKMTEIVTKFKGE
ncbi:MAG: hypothetical protein RBR02_06395 [Desulfuromonadaceae bacterium]|nr:hypothetical protein [Desulfuromonadaceae bacterium]